MTIAATLILSFLVCAAGVFLFRRIASGSALLLDIPNERSSHSQPVVRGAGLAIVVTVLTAYILLTGPQASLSYIVAAVIVAFVSFIDDLRSIPFIPRLIVHFAAATAVVFWCGGYPGLSIPFAGTTIEFGLSGVLVTIFFIVWTTNAFNFMDGIDGLAGIQGVGAGLGWMMFGILSEQPTMAAIGAAIAGACLGFLLFNWQPASVFMGDVGSTFLGFTLACIPLFTAKTTSSARSEGFTLAAAFLWLFLFDTVFTRLGQMVRLRPFWRAHREHLYQRIVVGGASHKTVASAFGLFAGLSAISVVLLPHNLQFPSIILLLAGPILLIWFAWKKRLT